MPAISHLASNRYKTRSSTSTSSAAQQLARSSTHADAEGVTGPSSSEGFRQATPSEIPSLKRKKDPQASIRVPQSVRKHVQISTKLGQKPLTRKSRAAITQDVRAESPARQSDDAVNPPKKRRSRPSAVSEEEKQEEKRLRLFRKNAPHSYLQKLARATSQRYFESPVFFMQLHVMLMLYVRMFVLDRMRGGTDDVPEETIAMAGSTGNVYHITICQVPRCTCPDSQKSNQCKHIIYVSCTYCGSKFIADE